MTHNTYIPGSNSDDGCSDFCSKVTKYKIAKVVTVVFRLNTLVLPIIGVFAI